MLAPSMRIKVLSILCLGGRIFPSKLIACSEDLSSLKLWVAKLEYFRHVFKVREVFVNCIYCKMNAPNIQTINRKTKIFFFTEKAKKLDRSSLIILVIVVYFR